MHKYNKSTREEVLKWYAHDPITNKSTCRVANCDSKLSGRILGNMKRHIMLRHPALAKQLYLVETDQTKFGNSSLSVDGYTSDSSESCSFNGTNVSTIAEQPPPAKKKKICESRFVKGCIKLCTEEDVPFGLFDSDAFQMLAEPFVEGLRVAINGAIMLEKVNQAAEFVRSKISEELKPRLFSVKVDLAMRQARGVLAIHAQFLSDGILQVRTLGFIEWARGEGEISMKTKLDKLLNDKYGLLPMQVYSITSDSVFNMMGGLKSVEKDDAEAEDKYYATVAKQLDAETDASVAITLQYVVAEVAKSCQTELNTVRKFVKQLNIPKFDERFAQTGTTRPPLDVATRWLSTFLMVKSLYDNMEFYKQLTDDPNTDVELPADIGEFIAKYTEAFTPLYAATKRCQEETLTMGDFFKNYIQCSMECQQLVDKDGKNKLAIDLLQGLERWQVKLFEKPTFVAALYLDPRFNFFGSSVLSTDHKKVAKDQIFNTWLQLKQLAPLDSTSSEPSYGSQDSDLDCLDQFFRKKYKQPTVHPKVEKTDQEIQQQVFNISHQARVLLQESVLVSWEMRRYDDHNLYKISQVVLAVPASQVTVERAVRVLELIQTARQNRLSDSTIEDLLVCRLNPEIFDQI